MTRAQSIDDVKKCEVLLIGNELLIGKTRDFNGFWLAQQFAALGISVTRITTIRDDTSEIALALRETLARAPDYVVTSGGLGPTFDDATLEGIAAGLGVSLEMNETALGWIKERYRHGHRIGWTVDAEINDARRKMARLPSGSVPLSNSAGAAPGVLLTTGPTKVFVLPGVPRELQAIFHDHVAPVVTSENASIVFYQDGFTVGGVGESTMAEKVLELMDDVDPHIWIKSHARYKDGHGYVEMHVSGYGDKSLGYAVAEAGKKARAAIKALGGMIEELEE